MRNFQWLICWNTYRANPTIYIQNMFKHNKNSFSSNAPATANYTKSIRSSRATSTMPSTSLHASNAKNQQKTNKRIRRESQTSQKLRQRFKNHIFDIRNDRLIPVARRFNLPEHPQMTLRSCYRMPPKIR